MKTPDSGFGNILNSLKSGKERKNPIPSETEIKNISNGFKMCGQIFADAIDGKAKTLSLYELATYHHLDQYMDEYDNDGNLILK